MLTELHCHTIFSKGRKVYVEGIDSPEQMLRQAKLNKTEAMAITDHDSLRGYLEARKHAKKYNILLISGEEVSSADGHILALGIAEEIRPGMSAEETVDIIHNQGGVAVSPHPFDVKRDGLGAKALVCDAAEAFNANNLERISNWKAQRFLKKHSLPVTAGSDAHSAELLGTGLNNLRAEKDVDSVLKAIKKGRNEIVAKYPPISAVRRWSILRLKYSFNQTRAYINKNYKWPKRELSLAMLNQVKKSPGNIDYLFQGLAYFSIGSSVAYSAFREIFGGFCEQS